MIEYTHKVKIKSKVWLSLLLHQTPSDEILQNNDSSLGSRHSSQGHKISQRKVRKVYLSPNVKLIHI